MRTVAVVVGHSLIGNVNRTGVIKGGRVHRKRPIIRTWLNPLVGVLCTGCQCIPIAGEGRGARAVTPPFSHATTEFWMRSVNTRVEDIGSHATAIFGKVIRH